MNPEELVGNVSKILEKEARLIHLPSQGKVGFVGDTHGDLDASQQVIRRYLRELTGTNVHVSVLRAGPVRTEFGQAALLKENGGHVPTEKIGVTAEAVADRIWHLIRRPRRVAYIPGWLRVVPWAELSFGWIIDRLGPLLLKQKKA